MPVVYSISCPFTHNIVYVGCTNDLRSRKLSHLTTKLNTPISKWIQEIKSKGALPVFEEMPKSGIQQTALNEERFWISQLTGLGINLLNVRSKH